MYLETCRFCKKSNWDRTKYGMVKYGLRHHAHADCLLKARGVEAFAKLSTWQLNNFPFFAAKDFGLSDALVAEIKARRA